MQRRVLKHTDTQTHRQTDRQTDAHSHTTTPLGSLQQAGTWRAPADVILDRSGHSAGAADWTTGQLASTTPAAAAAAAAVVISETPAAAVATAAGAATACVCVVCGYNHRSAQDSVSRQHCDQHYSSHLCQRFAPCGT